MDPRLRRTEVKQAVDVARVAQRNWDLDRQIPEEDLETLIYAAQNSPKKQMETHFSLHVFTHKEKIREIYNKTKKFSVYPVTDISPENEDDWKPPENMFADIDGNFYQDDHFSVKNSQILANVMFVYCLGAQDEVLCPAGDTLPAQQNHQTVKTCYMFHLNSSPPSISNF